MASVTRARQGRRNKGRAIEVVNSAAMAPARWTIVLELRRRTSKRRQRDSAHAGCMPMRGAGEQGQAEADGRLIRTVGAVRKPLLPRWLGKPWMREKHTGQ